eukprot:jgi/Mesvir1/27971/Mv20176-RA.1
MKPHHVVFFKVVGNDEVWMAYRFTESKRTPWQPAGVRDEDAPRSGRARMHPYKHDDAGKPLFGVRVVDPDLVANLEDTPKTAPLDMRFFDRELVKIQNAVASLPSSWQSFFNATDIQPTVKFLKEAEQFPDKMPKKLQPLPWPTRAEIAAMRDREAAAAAAQPAVTQADITTALIDEAALRAAPLVDPVCHDGRTRAEWVEEDRAFGAKVAFEERLKGVLSDSDSGGEAPAEALEA